MNIFVYGSLRQGFGNHRLLSTSRFIGPAKTTPDYEMVSLGWFPGVFEGGKTAITGELYDVNEGVLASLDRLEGHPSFYRRTPVEVVDQDGNTIGASIYLLPKQGYEDYTPISSGDWSERG